MILRRFVKHVTDQNWFAVGLDVLVVITGIFLGMQVTEWNEQRKETQREHLFLTQLNSDIRFVLTEIERAQSEHDLMAQRGKLAIRLLRGEDLLADHQQDIESAFQEMHQIPKPQIHFGNLKTILNGAAHSRITLLDADKKLADLSNRLGAFVEVYQVIENNLDELALYFRPHVGFAVPDDSNFPIRYDLEKMRASSEFQNGLQNAVNFQTYASSYLEKMSALLTQFLGEAP